MIEGIIEASQLPEGEKIYLKKDKFFGEWKVVYPTHNEDGTINWKNLLIGSKWNLVFIIFVLLLLGIGYLGINELIEGYKSIADNPCNFCSLNLRG